MSSTFSGLNTALTALNAQRRGLDVTGQNVANANTDGYTRQRVTLTSVGASAHPSMWSTYQGSGEGVSADSVARLSDDFLTSRQQTEHGRLASLASSQAALGRIEQSFGEPGDTGLQKQLGDFWKSWSSLANAPGDAAARKNVLSTANTVAASFLQTRAALASQWQSGREQITTVAASINTAAANVADLNMAIMRADQAGLPDNELKDKRDSLILDLSDLAGATSRPGVNGAVDVYIGGSTLVRGDRVNQVAVSGTADMAQAATDPVALSWADDGRPVDGVAGQTGGLLETVERSLPAYAGQLDAVAATLASTVNTLHSTGYDQDGNTAGPMFAGTTAATLSVAITDARSIAATSAAGGGLGNDVALALGRAAADPTGPDASYRQLIVGLGVESQTVSRRMAIQSNVTAQVDSSKDSQTGVDTDEEMVNLLTYQHAYEAAAKVMAAVDAMLDTLINRTGR